TRIRMTPKQIAEKLKHKFGDAITASLPEDKHPRVHTTAAHWRSMAETLRQDAELDFDFLLCLTGVDYVADDQLCVVYDLRSMTRRHEFAVKVYVDRGDPRVASVMDIWPAADWHEREAFDMFGIIFEGHADLRRILLPEDWVSYPLRKDYLITREYTCLPGTVELDRQQEN